MVVNFYKNQIIVFPGFGNIKVIVLEVLDEDIQVQFLDSEKKIVSLHSNFVKRVGEDATKEHEFNKDIKNLLG